MMGVGGRGFKIRLPRIYPILQLVSFWVSLNQYTIIIRSVAKLAEWDYSLLIDSEDFRRGTVRHGQNSLVLRPCIIMKNIWTLVKVNGRCAEGENHAAPTFLF